MQNKIYLTFFAILLVQSCENAFAEEPEVLVQLARSRVHEGESVRYTVTLNHCEDTAKPTLPDVPNLQFRQTSVRVVRQTTIINSVRTSIGGPSYEYVLIPNRNGEFTIPGPTVVVDGKTYRGQAVTLQVSAPEEQDLAILETSVDRHAVYPLQPFTVKLKIALKAMPDPYTAEDPLRGTGSIPVLIIPWADDQNLPDGVKPDSPVERWLSEFIPSSRRTVGFGINNLRFSSDDIFGLFAEQQRAMFRPTPKQLKRQDRQGRTVEYWEYIFERTFTAAKLGRISFGPVSLKGSFATRVSSAGKVDGEEVYAVAKPIEVEVQDVPAAGRPDSYIGAVGRFELDANLSPTTAKVGDPMTLSLRVHGTGSLEQAFAPKSAQQGTIADNFKIYEATEQSGDGERTFTYSLRPRNADLKEFPPIEVAYFDVEKEKYVSVKTPPIKIQVAESDRVADQEIAVADRGAASTRAVEAASDGLFANITDSRQIYNERVQPNFWFVALAGMAMTFLICSYATHQLQRQKNDPQHQRRRNAAKRAQSALAEARRLAAAGSRREAIDTLRAAITGLVADAVGSLDVSLTSRDAAQKLATVGIPEDLCKRCHDLLDEFDATRYGGGAHSLDEQIQSAGELVADLLREFRQRKLAS